MPVRERVAAWFYTGPIGHLYGVIADIVELWTRYLTSRVRRRLSSNGRALP